MNFWFALWEEERHRGVMGCHEKRIRLRLLGVTITLWRWEP